MGHNARCIHLGGGALTTKAGRKIFGGTKGALRLYRLFGRGEYREFLSGGAQGMVVGGW